MIHIRPSSLPKWAGCPCFESREDAGPAASRGNQLDKAFRLLMTGDRSGLELIDPADIAAVQWAVETLRAIAGTATVFTGESDCHLPDIPLMDKGGTVDAVMPLMLASADLKSGKIHNYREQMAAYAMGWMERYFESRWTTYLLFCDQREVVKHEWTWDSALAVVRPVVEARRNPERVPKPCDYCDWCQFAETCPARVGMALATIEETTDDRFRAILDDPVRLGAFLDACAPVEKYLARARERARQIIGAGVEVPGWKMRSSGEVRLVSAIHVGQHIGRLGFGHVLEAYGPMAADKFMALWSMKMGDTPFPSGIIESSPKAMALVKASVPAKAKRSVDPSIAPGPPAGGWIISMPGQPDETITDQDMARERVDALRSSDVYGVTVMPPLPPCLNPTPSNNQ